MGFRSLRHLNDRVRVNQDADEDVPFLMVTSFIHPHDPYEPPREHWDRFDDVDIRIRCTRRSPARTRIRTATGCGG